MKVAPVQTAATPNRMSLQTARNWLLLAISIVAIFVLQPASAIRSLNLWLPAASLLVTVAAWLAVFLARRRLLVRALLLVLMGLLLALKIEPVADAISTGLRALNGQNLQSASAADISWLGFSYIVFRLMHVLRDFGSPRLPALNLREFVTYVLFAPSIIAGPIDRAERFATDLRTPWQPSRIDAAAGVRRIVLGVFKKFVLADVLAMLALNEQNAAQASGAGWMWLLVVAFAARIYFDFGGYTDLALGAARLLGIRLPENFDAPYLKPNITLFWNSWHMSLSAWFRTYWFNPVLRALRARKLPVWVIVGLCHFSTMLLIGLWHGVSLNFLVWGAWHAAGLFVHNRWMEYCRAHARAPVGRIGALIATLATCAFVALGWVWFALPGVQLSARVFKVLFFLG